MSATASIDPGQLRKMSAAAESLVVRARSGDQNAIAMISEVRKNVRKSRKAAAAYDLLCRYVEKNPVVASFGGLGSALRGYSSELRCVGLAAADDRKYGHIPKYVDRLPTRTDRYEQAAHLVADGQPVTASRIRLILPHLRGRILVLDGEPVPVEDAEAAKDWKVVIDPTQGCGVEPVGGASMGLSRPDGKAVSSAALFCAAFNRAGDVDRVLALAEPFASEERQPVRLGYVMGLARLMQLVRVGRSPRLVSEMIGWELGE